MWSVLRVHEGCGCHRSHCYDDSSSQLLLRHVLDLPRVLSGFASVDGVAHSVCHHYGCASGGVHSSVEMGLLVVVLHLLHDWTSGVLSHPSHVFVLEHGRLLLG